MTDAILLLLQIGAVALMSWVCFVLAARCCGADRIVLGAHKIPLDLSPAPAGEPFTGVMARRAALWGAGALAVTYAVSALWCAATRETVTLADMLDIWMQWDANNFVRIAELGYGGFELDGMHTTLVFFPLYPWLMRAVHLLVPDWALCGHILSGACYIGACVVLARLVTEQFGRRTARLTLALLSGYPFAFFFGAVYGESLFLLLSAAAFYRIRRHHWLRAGILGALAALTRMQGALLLAVGLIEYCAAGDPLGKLRRRDLRGLGRDMARVWLPLAVTLAGTGLYLAVNWAVDGDPFQFVAYERQVWHQGFAPMPKSLAVIWNELLTRLGHKLMFTTWGPELALFLVSMAALAYAARRMPPVWTAYLAGCAALNYSLAWPLSCGRYMACAFPLFAALAQMLRRRPAAGWSIAAAMGLLQGGYLIVYLSGGQVL